MKKMMIAALGFLTLVNLPQKNLIAENCKPKLVRLTAAHLYSPEALIDLKDPAQRTRARATLSAVLRNADPNHDWDSSHPYPPIMGVVYSSDMPESVIAMEELDGLGLMSSTLKGESAIGTSPIGDIQIKPSITLLVDLWPEFQTDRRNSSPTRGPDYYDKRAELILTALGENNDGIFINSSAYIYARSKDHRTDGNAVYHSGPAEIHTAEEWAGFIADIPGRSNQLNIPILRGHRLLVDVPDRQTASHLQRQFWWTQQIAANSKTFESSAWKAFIMGPPTESAIEIHFAIQKEDIGENANLEDYLKKHLSREMKRALFRQGRFGSVQLVQSASGETKYYFSIQDISISADEYPKATDASLEILKLLADLSFVPGIGSIDVVDQSGNRGK